MQCKICQEELIYKELLGEIDPENQRVFSYYFCDKCESIYDRAGDLCLSLAKPAGNKGQERDSK